MYKNEIVFYSLEIKEAVKGKTGIGEWRAHDS
jgi:hypothetical protein